MHDTDTDLLTRQEAAKLLRISLRSLDKLISENEGPPTINLGRRVFFHRRLIKAWIDARFGLAAEDSAPESAALALRDKKRRGRPRG